MEKKTWEAGYSAWEILGGSEERSMGIFDLLGTLGHEKLVTVCQTGELGPGSLECEGLAVRRGPRIPCQISPQPLLWVDGRDIC